MSGYPKTALMITAIAFAIIAAGMSYAVVTRFPPVLPLSAPFLWSAVAVTIMLVVIGAIKPGEDYSGQAEKLKETVIAQARQIEEKAAEIKLKDKLLLTVTSLTDLLLTAKKGVQTHGLLLPALELIGRAMEADRVQIWRRGTEKGEPGYVHLYQWLSEEGRCKAPVRTGLTIFRRDHPEWEERFAYGECINTPVSLMPENEQDVFRPFETESVFILPITIEEELWGFLKVDDCGEKRFWSGEETDTLYSAARMIASALKNRRQALAEDSAEETAFSDDFGRGNSEVA